MGLPGPLTILKVTVLGFERLSTSLLWFAQLLWSRGFSFMILLSHRFTLVRGNIRERRRRAYRVLLALVVHPIGPVISAG